MLAVSVSRKASEFKSGFSARNRLQYSFPGNSAQYLSADIGEEFFFIESSTKPKSNRNGGFQMAS
jgi:hypothetical protein